MTSPSLSFLSCMENSLFNKLGFVPKTKTLKKGGSLTFPMAACRKWKPMFVILAVYFLMAVMNILLKKVLDEDKSQLVIVTYRLVTGAIFLTPIAYFCERKSSIKLTTPIMCQLFFSGLVGATLAQYLFLIGMQYTSAAFSLAFSNMTPVLTFLLALPLRQESVNLRSKRGIAKVLGSLICIGGVVLLMLYRGFPLNRATHSGKSSDRGSSSSTATKLESHHRWIYGSLFLILSVLCWSGWFLLQSRIGKKYPCKYTSTAMMSAFGAAQSGILCFAINRDITIWILRGKLEIFTVLFAGIFGSGLCYVGMSWCVDQRGPVFTAAFTPFAQIFVTIMDFAFFHELIYFGSVIGSVLVVSGLYILLWGKSREAVNNIAKPYATAAEAAEECNASSANATTSTTISDDSMQATSNPLCRC